LFFCVTVGSLSGVDSGIVVDRISKWSARFFKGPYQWG